MNDKLIELESLMSVLSHKIRTPLSIIQNELTCLKPQIGEEEYQRLLTACKNINNILKEPVLDLLSEGKLDKDE